MECRLTQSPGEPWKCQVSLRIEYSDETGKRLPETREKKFGPLITDPSLLEDVLRRAQLAVLNRKGFFWLVPHLISNVHIHS